MSEAIEDVASGSFHHDRASKVFLILGLFSLLLALIVGIGAVVYTHKNDTWNPLGDYSVQTVTPNTIRLNETVNTRGRKCSKEDNIRVRFEGRTWKSATSGIVIAESNSGETLRFKSCGPNPNSHEYVFKNYIPQAIQDIVRAHGPSLWYITSTEIPFKSNGEQGVPRTWTTETFKLVP